VGQDVAPQEITGQLGVSSCAALINRALLVACLRVPRGGPEAQRSLELVVCASKLTAKRLLNQRVPPVAGMRSIHRYQQRRKSGQSSDRRRRPTARKDRIADRPAKLVQDRCLHREGLELGGQGAEYLVLDVLGHQVVLAPELECVLGTIAQ